MSASRASGPSAGEWRRVELSTGPALVLPAADESAVGTDRLHYYLPAAPRLASDSAGKPALSLTIELAGTPVTADVDDALVRGGWLAMTVTLALAEGESNSLEAAVGAPCRPLFAREVRISLVRDHTVLAEAAGAGPDARIALAATLDRDAAVAALRALDGASSGIAVRTLVRYQTAAVEMSLRMTGTWVDVYDALSARAGPEGTLDRAGIRDGLETLLQSGAVRAMRLGASNTPPHLLTHPDVPFEMFLGASGFILERSSEAAYKLRRRPHPAMRMDLTETVTAEGDAQRELIAPLGEVLEALRTTEGGLTEDQYLHFIMPGESGAPVRVGRRVRSRRTSGRTGGPAGSLSLAARAGRVTSVALALTPERDKRPSAHGMLASDFARPARPDISLWLADDFVLDKLEGAEEAELFSLPVVENASSLLWPDRRDWGRYWYVPAWEPVVPSPSDEPSAAPFLFTFEAAGVTNESTPNVGLTGSVRFTVRQVMPEAVRAELASRGNPPAQPVPLDNVSVALDLPFLDKESGETRRQLFPAAIESSGQTITATVDLLNEWVRLCYGALAYPGFQTEPVRLRVAYAYRAYVPIRDHRVQLAFGGKIAMMTVLDSKKHRHRVLESTDRAAFDPDRLVVHLPGGELHLKREAPGPPRGLRPRPAKPQLFTGSAAIVAAVSAVAVATRPELDVASDVVEGIRAAKYGTRTILGEASPDVVFPCSTLGAFYRQVLRVSATASEEEAVGCRDSLRLGETPHRQYEEIAELRDPRYRVFRSLQQPGRFLVFPSVYRITRYGAGEPPDRAYRPAIMLYTLVGDAETEPRYFFRATLAPDVPLFARERLREVLAPLSPHGYAPVLDFPTDPGLQKPDEPARFE